MLRFKLSFLFYSVITRPHRHEIKDPHGLLTSYGGKVSFCLLLVLVVWGVEH